MRYLVCVADGRQRFRVAVHTWEDACTAYELVRFCLMQAAGLRVRDLQWNVETVV